MATSNTGRTGAETLSTLNDKVTLDELIERYRSEHDPAEPPLDTAASVLAWAGDRLDDETKRALVTRGTRTAYNERIPPEIQLSGQSGSRVPPGKDAVIDEREATVYLDSFSDDPERMVMPLGLVMEERIDGLRADLTAGRLRARALTQDDYVEVYGTVDNSQGGEIIGCFGWMPIGIVAIVAGIVVALISSNWWLFLLIALGGTILGYLAILGVMIVYDWLDVRWLRLGRQDDVGVILFFTGPVVALLIALLVLNIA
jgi:hypothetical protein